MPRKSFRLAELVGIILGDGGITARQVTVSLHKVDDRSFAEYVALLIKDLFHIPLVIRERRNSNVVTILASRTDLVQYFVDSDLCNGSKVRQQVGVPEWIIQNDKYSVWCVRGLFDTDGCTYIDRHIISGKTYLNIGMNFTNRSLPLLSFFFNTLKKNGYSPTRSTPFAIVLRKEKDIIRYFKHIGTSNKKHQIKFDNYFLTKNGRVPKRS